MPEQKTKPTEASVADFIDKVDSELVRDDCRALVKMLRKSYRQSTENVGAKHYWLWKISLQI